MINSWLQLPSGHLFVRLKPYKLESITKLPSYSHQLLAKRFLAIWYFRTDVMFRSFTTGSLFVLIVSVSLQQIAASQQNNQTDFACAQDIVNRLNQITQKLDDLDTKLSSCVGTNSTCKTVPKNCAEIYSCGQKQNGVYMIDPDGKGSFSVYCDQTTDGGGWTVFQRRLDGKTDFYFGWSEYKNGFGNLQREYWLGLEKIHRLTHQQSYKLRIDLEDWNWKTAYAVYSLFGVADENNKYKLSLGTYSGNAGDSLSPQKGMAFSTKDRDNDSSLNNCATLNKGAWWYRVCQGSNLNGLYLHGGNDAKSVSWYKWKNAYYSVKKANMKIRPVKFVPSY